MTQTHNRLFVAGAATILAAAFFGLDLNVPLGVAAGVPYVVVVLVGLWSPRRGDILRFAFICSILTVVGLILSPAGGEAWKVASNRALAILAIWAVGVLGYLLRCRNEELLRASESKLHLLLESTAEAIYRLDLEGNCTYCNRACVKMLGYAGEADLLGRNMHELIHHSRADGSPYPAQQCLIYQAFKAGQGTHVTDEVLWRADGSSFPAEYWSYPVWENGKIIGSVVTFLDITERKRTERELHRFRMALDCSADSIFLIDRATMCFVDVNETACTSVGYSRQELLTMGPQHIKPRFLEEQLERKFDEIIASENEFGVIETVHRRKDGSEFPVEVLLKSLLGKSERLLIALARDITERKRTEKQMFSAKNAAESANRSKSEFLANMSHEIRTPMTAILGFAEQLLEPGLPESERLRSAQTIRRNGENLLGIINDILDLSKIEAGKMSVEHIACQPCRIVSDVASLVRVRAGAKALLFNIEYIGAIPQTIQSDPIRLRQILINLIGNAIKFTEVGSVRLVTRLVDHPGEPHLQFDVIDTGQGLTENQAAKLFEPFMQADASSTRAIGGTGLGLTISKRFGELLGGTVSLVGTEVGVGTTFRATVATGPLEGVKMLDDPMSATTISELAIAHPAIERSSLQGCRILLAEDGPDNQRLISQILEKAGAEVTVAENGKLALDAALEASHCARRFDIVLMDMQMPVMDGYEATASLRQNGYNGTIIALTAHAMTGDRDKCMRAGCDQYATKPVDRKKLVEMIQAHFQPAAAQDAHSVTV